MNTYTQDIKKIFNLSLPMITSQITRLLNGFIATIFIAKLGTDDLAAIALGQSFWLVFFLFCMGLFFSTSILVGNHFAANRQADIERTTAHAIVIAIVISIPISIILFSAKHIFILFGQNPVVAQLAQEYVTPLSFAIMPLFISLNLQQFLIGISRPKILNLFSLITLGINVTLFYTLIFGHFGFPKLGIAGAGYSIAIASWINLLLTAFYIKIQKDLKKYNLFVRVKEFSFKQVKLILNIGWPIGSTMVLEMIAQIIFVFFIGIISTKALAAYQVVWQIALISLMIPVACSQAVAVVISQHIGADECNQIRRAAFITWALCLSLVLIFSLIFWFAPETVVGLFLNHTNYASYITFHLATVMIMVSGFIQLFDATRFILNGCLRGMRDVKTPMLVSITGFWIIGIPLAAIVVFVLKLSVIMLWWSSIVGLLMIVLLLLRRFLKKTASFV